MRVLKDIPIVTRDSTCLICDIFLPDEDGNFPAIISLSPYQKDVQWHVPSWHTAAQHEYQNWETPDPIQWTGEGYVVVRVDARGSGKSGGVHSVFSKQEASDFYDAIEWLASQDWCTGMIGATGVSYYAMSQWRVAAMAPPSLKAIVPASGSADIYREFIYRGGMFLHDFFVQWYTRLVGDHFHGKALHDQAAYGEEWAIREFIMHDLDGPYWDQRRPDFENLHIPFLSTSSWHTWHGPGHVRGNLETFKGAPSKNKRLRISTEDIFLDYYSDEMFGEQLAWFDHWLKNDTHEGFEQPRVRVKLQSSEDISIWRNEDDWPLPGTKTLNLFLGGSENDGYQLKHEKQNSGVAEYNAPGELPPTAEPIGGAMKSELGVEFISDPFPEVTELVGEAALKLWGASTYEDMDLHIFLDLITKEEKPIELSRGWLKASHRELDVERSTERRPFLKHSRRIFLSPGVKEEMEVEIWPFAVRIQPGERLRLRIAGTGPGFLSSWHRRPRGLHTILFGGDDPSVLKLPMVSPSGSQ